METRTSASHPIGVDWAHGPASHRIGLTFAPGKKDPSTIGNYRWDRDLAADLDRLITVHGATVLACLVEDHELPTLGIPDLVGEAQRPRHQGGARIGVRYLSSRPRPGRR